MGAIPRVLVVDGDQDIRAVLAEWLWACGFYVDVVANGLDAIEVLEHGTPPDAVLTKQRMPGLLGSELIEYIRGRPELADVPAVIVATSPPRAADGCRVFTVPWEVGALVSFLLAATI